MAVLLLSLLLSSLLSSSPSSSLLLLLLLLLLFLLLLLLLLKIRYIGTGVFNSPELRQNYILSFSNVILQLLHGISVVSVATHYIVFPQTEIGQKCNEINKYIKSPSEHLSGNNLLGGDLDTHVVVLYFFSMLLQELILGMFKFWARVKHRLPF